MLGDREQFFTCLEKEAALNRTVRFWTGHLLPSLHVRRRLFDRPILIFSTRRSGSTLLMSMIYSQKGLNYSAQPLDLWRHAPYRNRLPEPHHNQFISLDTEEDEKKVRSFFEQVLADRIRRPSQWNVFHPDYSFVVNRMVVKLLNASPLIDWFSEQFGGDIVYFLRHPIPVSLSAMRKGWECIGEAFLQNASFQGKHIDEERGKEYRRILQQGTSLQKHVLEWGLVNLYPLSIFRERHWLTLTYEELLSRPHQVCQLVASRFDLPDPKRMQQRMLSPSRTTSRRSRAHLAERGPDYLLTRWLDEVSPEAAREAMAVLDELLGMKIYTWDSPFPSSSLCHLGPLDDDTAVDPIEGAVPV